MCDVWREQQVLILSTVRVKAGLYPFPDIPQGSAKPGSSTQERLSRRIAGRGHLSLSLSFFDENEDEAKVTFPHPLIPNRNGVDIDRRHDIRLARRNPHKRRFAAAPSPPVPPDPLPDHRRRRPH